MAPFWRDVSKKGRVRLGPPPPIGMPRRQSWASSVEPGTTWSSTLSEHLRRALSKASEAAASIPAVRVDVQRCPENAPVEAFDGASSDVEPS